jgi:hypothetical protein
MIQERILEHCSDAYHITKLVEYEPGVWEVLTDRRLKDGTVELVNNTGTLDHYHEAIQNFEWHLDLYYGTTLEELRS